jgi:hypothetical protein
MRRSVYRRYRVLKKNPWIIGLSLAAFALAPSLQAASAAQASPAVSEKADSAKASDGATDKAAADTDKAASTADAASDTPAATAHHKSPALAGGLAFFPGVAVHGAGHMYAGSWMKGLGLLAIEAASAAVIVKSASGLGDAANVFSGGKSVPTDISGVEINVGTMVVSSMGFLWSWFDDMAGAPIAAGEYNKIQDQKSTAQLELVPGNHGAQLALSTNF